MLKLWAFVVVYIVANSHQWGLLTTKQQQNLTQMVTQSARINETASLDPIVAASTSLSNVAIPVPLAGYQPLTLPVKGAIAIDQTTGTVLFEQTADTQLPIASLTKLVTALVILSNHHLDDVVTIPTLPTYQAADARMGLLPGDHFSISQLVSALLIPSANDAADALAIYHSGSLDAFSQAQNAKLKLWSVPTTHLANASGLSDDNNYSTARDLSKIANLALINPFIRSVVSQPNLTITNQEGRVYQLATTNQLLSIKDFHGIKTGYTLAAGQCYIGLVTINGHEVITVVLGAQDRFGNTKTMTDWIKNNWQWL